MRGRVLESSNCNLGSLFNQLYSGHSLSEVSASDLALYTQFGQQICSTVSTLSSAQTLNLLCTKYPQYALFNVCTSLLNQQINLVRTGPATFVLQTQALTSAYTLFTGSFANITVAAPSFPDPLQQAVLPSLTFASSQGLRFQVPANIGTLQVTFPASCVAPLLLVSLGSAPTFSLQTDVYPLLTFNAAIIGIPSFQSSAISFLSLFTNSTLNPSAVSALSTQEAHFENLPVDTPAFAMLVCSALSVNRGSLDIQVRAWTRPPPAKCSGQDCSVTDYTIPIGGSVTQIVGNSNVTRRLTVRAMGQSSANVAITIYPDQSQVKSGINPDAPNTGVDVLGFQTALAYIENVKTDRAALVSVVVENIEPSNAVKLGLGLGLGLGLAALVSIGVGGYFLWRHRQKKLEAEMGPPPAEGEGGLRRMNSYTKITELAGFAGTGKAGDGSGGSTQHLPTSPEDLAHYDMGVMLGSLGDAPTRATPPSLPQPFTKAQPPEPPHDDSL